MTLDVLIFLGSTFFGLAVGMVTVACCAASTTRELDDENRLLRAQLRAAQAVSREARLAATDVVLDAILADVRRAGHGEAS